MKVGVVGAGGFVGSAFARYLSPRPDVDLLPITRQNYAEFCGRSVDVLMNANGNSRKYLAAQDPLKDFDLSVRSTLQIVLDFPATLYVHLSSIDVYNNISDPAQNTEDTPIIPERLSAYGFSKYLSELVARRHAACWLIVRLGGMVGPGLWKNPIYDLTHGQPLRVHPSSAYQYMHTDDVTRIVWGLVERNISAEVYNVCGDGVIALSDVQAMLALPSEDNGLERQWYEINVGKLKTLESVPRTVDTVRRFLQ